MVYNNSRIFYITSDVLSLIRDLRITINFLEQVIIEEADSDLKVRIDSISYEPSSTLCTVELSLLKGKTTKINKIKLAAPVQNNICSLHSDVTSYSVDIVLIFYNRLLNFPSIVSTVSPAYVRNCFVQYIDNIDKEKRLNYTLAKNMRYSIEGDSFIIIAEEDLIIDSVGTIQDDSFIKKINGNFSENILLETGKDVFVSVDKVSENEL